MFSAVALLSNCLFSCYASDQTTLSISFKPPKNAPPPIPSGFVSFATEFSSFPSFAGNPNSPNNFSYQLLSNIGNIQGSNPVIRVGGNTAHAKPRSPEEHIRLIDWSRDFALLDPSQAAPLVGSTDPNLPPNTLTIGPSFFKSYLTWPKTTFIHNLNLASNTTAGLTSLKSCIALACEALRGGKVAFWELGNEPDYYKTSAQGPVRPSWWDEQDYVNEWLNKSRVVRDVLQENCPVEGKSSKFIGLSFANANDGLSAVITWDDGIDQDKDIAMLTGHFYMGSATQLGITLQGTLLNHSQTTALVSAQLSTWLPLASRARLPFAFTEVNSFSNKGVPGLSNTFAAALWVLDFNLYCASQGVSRVHMQQGLNFNYGAWQPVQTANMTIGTKAPYYGSVAVAKFLGDLTRDKVRVVEVGFDTAVNSAAYAAYVNGALSKIAVIQLDEYVDDSSHTSARPMTTYTFQLPAGMSGRSVSVQRLMANSSDAVTGVTFDRTSYNWDLERGKPVILKNATLEQVTAVGRQGTVSIELPWSSAAILSIT